MGPVSGDGSVTLDGAWTRRWIEAVAAEVSRRKAELTALDRAIGDADHGENLDRGFQAVLGRFDALDDGATPGAVLKLVATTLISTVGGAAGPLYGTAFLKAAMAAGDRDELDAAALVEVLSAARDGIVARGKAASGDKTLVDAWTPAGAAAAAARRSARPWRLASPVSPSCVARCWSRAWASFVSVMSSAKPSR